MDLIITVASFLAIIVATSYRLSTYKAQLPKDYALNHLQNGEERSPLNYPEILSLFRTRSVQRKLERW